MIDRKYSLNQNTDKQVKDTEFPSITICTEGIDMDAVLEAVTEDFNNWVRNNRNINPNSLEYTTTMKESDIKIFLNHFFGIDPETNINIEDIVLAYSSSEPDK